MSTKRLLSLDIFRGITIAFMIVVNTPGSWQYVYPPLRHSAWHGCTPTDLVFPAFLFIVGVSMWFSMKKYGHSLNTGALVKILYRTAVIFIIGISASPLPFLREGSFQCQDNGCFAKNCPGLWSWCPFVYLCEKKLPYSGGRIILLAYWLLMWLAGGSDPYSLEG